MGDCLNGKMPLVVHTAPAVARHTTGVLSPATSIHAPTLPIARTPGYSF